MKKQDWRKHFTETELRELRLITTSPFDPGDHLIKAIVKMVRLLDGKPVQLPHNCGCGQENKNPKENEPDE